MNAQQYALSMFALQLNERRARDYAMERAREYYYLGHSLKQVRILLLEARLHNHKAIRLGRSKS